MVLFRNVKRVVTISRSIGYMNLLVIVLQSSIKTAGVKVNGD